MSYEERVHNTEVKEVKAQDAQKQDLSQRVMADTMKKSVNEFANTIRQMQSKTPESKGGPLEGNFSIHDSAANARSGNGEGRGDSNKGSNHPWNGGAKPAGGGDTHAYTPTPATPGDQPLLKKAV